MDSLDHSHKKRKLSELATEDVITLIKRIKEEGEADLREVREEAERKEKLFNNIHSQMQKTMTWLTEENKALEKTRDSLIDENKTLQKTRDSLIQENESLTQRHRQLQNKALQLFLLCWIY